MPSQKSRLKKAKRKLNEVERSLDSKVSDQDKNYILDKWMWTVASAVVVIGAIWIGVFTLPGLTVADLFTDKFYIGAGIVGLFIAYLHVSDNAVRPFSVTFAFITLAVGAVIWSFLPASVTSQIPIESWLGVELPPVNAVTFLVLAVIFAGVFWAIEMRVKGQPKKPAKIFDKVLKRFGVVVDIYSAMAASLGLILFYFLLVGLEKGATVLGEIGSVLGVQPFIPSNLFAVLAGYLGLGGELPIIGSIPFLSDLTAGEFAFVTLLVVGIAVMSYFSGSGPTTRLFRQFK